ncbi:SMC-Scp complex subunit ScpB [Thermodesulfovibrio yellowstonii]|uniref:SMC-Scp complex subunit ScpB n=1 Tax=Thermodesulfovibrio yellowstonii TaxID=28262 RepID=UPI000684AFEA|nr:SMC-Scp complex subunit ScpB [Thermodesulfovibrio islandicus]
MLSVSSNLILAILALADREIYFEELAEVLGCSREEVRLTLHELKQYLAPSSLEVSVTEKSATLTVKPEYLKRLPERFLARKLELSGSAVETLAVIALKQPCTKQEIDSVRGVDSEKTLETLEKHGLVSRVILPSQGRPALYVLTERCIHAFGFKSYEEMHRFLIAHAGNSATDRTWLQQP